MEAAFPEHMRGVTRGGDAGTTARISAYMAAHPTEPWIAQFLQLHPELGPQALPLTAQPSALVASVLRGYCGKERRLREYDSNTCRNVDSGSWKLSADEVQTWASTQAACERRCASCSG